MPLYSLPEVKALDRVEILKASCGSGVFDVLVGVNLALREGLDFARSVAGSYYGC